MGIEIEKGLPIGKPVPGGRPPKYPFASLEVGDSFGIDEKDVRSARFSSSRYASLLSREFLVGKDDNGNWRAWRTA